MGRKTSAIRKSSLSWGSGLAGALVKEVANNRFTIQSDTPRATVSWQVTGIRKDRYANPPSV